MKNEKLHNIKTAGFKTPNDYFDSVEDSVFSKLNEPQILENTESPGFKVPKDYFESLDEIILSKVDGNESKVIPIFNWKKIAYVSGIAASVILAFNLFINNPKNVTFDNLETASIETYLMNEDLNAYDIAPYLGNVDLNSDNFVENTINASDIEDYLLQNSDVEHLITD